jgi:hypothetical protein
MKRLPILALGFIQAFALAVYISLVGWLMWYGQNWSNQEPGMLGTLFFLTIFVTSALISGLIALGYPGYLLFEHKDVPTAIKLVLCTVGWLGCFVLVLASFLF